jgi:peptidoglycan/xylan/chitin deacetylase (PgdA/CDA1 family)
MKVLSVFWHNVHANSTTPDVRAGNPTVGLFRRQIEYLVQNYTPVSVPEFLRIRSNKRASRSYSKPPVLLSFDDGFKNVIDYAVPVLNEFDVPAVLFVIGETLTDSNFVPWYVEVRHMVRRAAKKPVVYGSVKVDLSSAQGAAKLKHLFGVTFRACKVERERQHLLEHLAQALGTHRPMATELDADLRFAGNSDLQKVPCQILTIGSHAMTHRDLGTLSIDEQVFELEQSDLLLRKECPSYYPTIAYPSGSFNTETVRIAKGVYHAGFGTLPGCSFGNLYAYPRVALEDDSVQDVAYAVSARRLNYILPLKRFLHVTGLRPL